MFRKIFCISFTLFTIQSFSVLQLSAKTLAGGEIKFQNDTEVIIEEEINIVPRQDEEERPFENVPRVVSSVTKIIKGIVTGNVHDIFHGAFSFAPRETSNRIISVYNQVVGFPGTSTAAPTTAPIQSTAAPTTAPTQSSAAPSSAESAASQSTLINSNSSSEVVTEVSKNTTRIATKINSTESILHELSESAEFLPEEEEDIEEEDEEEYEEDEFKKRRTLPKKTSGAPELIKPST